MCIEFLPLIYTVKFAAQTIQYNNSNT